MKHLGSIKLETKRLILKSDTIEDINLLWDCLFSDKNAVLECNWMNFKTKDDFINRFNKNTELPNSVYAWTIWEKESMLPIGGISVHHQNDNELSCKIGYSIHPKYQNKGYCTEALIKVLDFLLNEVGYEKVIGECVLTNDSSKRVMEKANMKYDGIIVDETSKEVYSYSKKVREINR